MAVDINYTPPPTCRNFMLSDKFIRLIGGPVGSGKSTACIWELFRRACEQAPGPDGLRRTRFAIVRQTLVQLKSTVLKDILDWFGKFAEYRVSESVVYIEIGDIKSEWWLVPLEREEDARRLLSSQITGAFVNECIEVDIGLIAGLAGRCGRYPKPFASWKGLILDTNMPTEGSEWHAAMVNPEPDWGIFRQPGGLEEGAENLEWLLQNENTMKLPIDHPERRAAGRIYYERLARSTNTDWVRRYVHAEYGNDPSGTAVYRTTFKRSTHVLESVEPVPGRLLIVGQDFGRDPCSIITQVDHLGRLLVLEEVMAEDMGLELHIHSALRPALLSERYMRCPVVVIGDPSGASRSSIYETNSFDFLTTAGFTAIPAQTNDPQVRISAVENWLMAMRAGSPALVVDAGRCPQLVRAFEGGYRYGFMRTGQRRPLPDKNQHSHISDAMQYAALAAQNKMYSLIDGRIMGRKRQDSRPQVSSLGWT